MDTQKVATQSPNSNNNLLVPIIIITIIIFLISALYLVSKITKGGGSTHTQDVSSWKTYENKQMGVAVTYPKDSLLSVPADEIKDKIEVSYVGPTQRASKKMQPYVTDGYSLTVRIRRDLQNKSLDTAIQKSIEDSKKVCRNDNSYSAIRKSNFDGKEAMSYEVTNCNRNFTVSFILLNGKIVEVIELYSSDNYKQVTHGILSSLKLI